MTTATDQPTTTDVPAPVLHVTDYTARFRGASAEVLDGVTLHVPRGQVTSIVGETGSGKTLLASSILGIAPPELVRERGSIEFNGIELSTASDQELHRLRGDRLSIVFQEARVALNPAFTVGAQLADVARTHLGVSSREAKRRVLDLLARVHIDDPARRYRQYPHEFSGGMAQRAMIAMSLIAEPELVILDEPTTGLDLTVQAGILRVIEELVADGVTALLITHDLGVVAQLASDTVVLRHGRVVESGPTERVFTRPRESYTRQLLDAGFRLRTEHG